MKTSIFIILFLATFSSAQARSLQCVSYSGDCQYRISLASSSANLSVVGGGESCKLSAGQSISLRESQDSSEDWQQLDGESSRDHRYVQLRFAREMLNRANFAATLMISLEYTDASFMSTSISCE